MILYHTSDREIWNTDIRRGRKNADFGQGFYLSPDRDFIYRWAGKHAVVNMYELDETGLRIQHFTRDLDWFNYIFRNRRAQDELDADVVAGPVANDTIFDTLGIISSGFLAPEKALKLLLIGPEYTQFAIKTEKAAAQLHWTSSETIEKAEVGALKSEQAAYAKAFAKEMERIAEE